MLTSFSMPECLSNDIIELRARNNHTFDEDLWFEIDKNRTFLREYLLWVDKTNSLEDCQSSTEMFIKRWQEGSNYAYSIVLKSTGKAIGSIDIQAVDTDNAKAEIGYWLAEEHNGNRYMSMAVQLLEKEAFSQGMNRLAILVQKENLPSIRVAERNNYIYEGTLKHYLYKYGVFCDIKVFTKLNKA